MVKLGNIIAKAAGAAVLGAAMSYGVAWGLALPELDQRERYHNFPQPVGRSSGGIEESSMTSLGKDMITINYRSPAGGLNAAMNSEIRHQLEQNRKESVERGGPLPPSSHLFVGLPNDGRTYEQAITLSAGWPMRCVYSTSYQTSQNTQEITGGAPLPDMLTSNAPSVRKIENALPCVPYVSGLAINTSVYGAGLLGVMALGKGVRTAMRRHNHLCTQCGYSREGLASVAPCPECGTSA